MKIILSGGGTLGPVFPLLALAEKIKEHYSQTDFLWLGTKTGPERGVVEARGLRFKALAAGKLRRYWDLKNFRDLFLIKLGFWQALFFLKKEKPTAIISAGGFNSVPTVWAAWFLGIPCFIHQQDLLPSLANRLMAPFVKKITVAFKEEAKFFNTSKVVWVGNPVRGELFQGQAEKARQKFNLEKNLPVVAVLGGGTGALSLNEIIWEALPELTQFCQVIHMTGKGKFKNQSFKNYHWREFFGEDYQDIVKAAEVVITRAGLSTLSELAALGKAAVIVPMPDSHQEINARYFEERGAAEVWSQKELNPKKLIKKLQELLNDGSRRQELERNINKILPKNPAEKWLEVLKPWLNK